MRIAFIVPSFGAGGAERVASLLCNWWAKQGHTVSAIAFEASDAERLYTLDAAVTLRQIACFNRRRSLASSVATNIRRLIRLRSALNDFRPDVIVSFMTEANVVALWAAFGLGIPVVVSERNQPDRPGLGAWRRAARRLSYPMAAALVMQTEAIAEWGKKRFRVPVLVIPNPVHPTPVSKRCEEASGKHLIAVGRLVRQKGFDILISSFAKIARAHPNWKLIVYGEGPDRGALEAQIRSLSMTDAISLPGLSRDIAAVYARAALFVLPSRFEGYPNVLLEALASGCPVVATDCPGATAEILQNGRYGVLVPPEDVHALASALDRLMSDQCLRTTYSQRAKEAVAALDVSTIGRRWLVLFESLHRSRAVRQ
jgi:glycosyltransferase involved in cell wall biosynthesis